MRVAKLFLGSKPVLAGLSINVRVAQERKLLSCVHVGHLLDEALGEDNIDLFQRTVFRFGIEEVDDREEACVDRGEEEICACDGVSYDQLALRMVCLPHLMFEIMTGVAMTMVKFLCLRQ